MAPLIVLACVLALASGTSNSIMLTLNADSAGLPFRRLWGTQVKPCSNNAMGDPNFISKSNTLLKHLPVPPTFARNQDKTLLFTDRVSRVRLLGGWKGGPGPASGDFVKVAADGASFTSDWSKLFGRLDAIVAANLSLEIVFDNVPWGFVRNASKLKHAGTYGNPWAPDDDLKELYAEFINATVAAIVHRYGANAAGDWLYRISTEPNCSCHWLDSLANWIWMYEVVAQAVRGLVGPTAQLSPANFPRGLSMNIVHDINTYLAHNTTHVPQVLGVSYYGGAAAGYRAADMGGTANWMRGFADAIVQKDGTSKTKVQFMEYGTLENSVRQRSNEPGIFGTAFTLNGWIVAMNPQTSIDQTYHWTAMDYVVGGPGGTTPPLLFGWAWLLAVGEQFVGGSTMLASTTMPFSTDRNATSVAAIASSFHDQLFVAVSTFSTYAYNASSVCAACGESYAATLAIERAALPKRLQQGGDTGAAAAAAEVAAWSLNTSSSWYDEIWRDLSAIPGGLDHSAKNYVYQLGKMASSTVGKQHVAAHFAKYNAMQEAALAPGKFEGSVLSSNATHLVLGFDTRAPEVLVLKIT